MFNIDFCEKINEIKNEICVILKNSSVENNKREDFNNIIDFDAIFAQDICFFDVAKNVANKINSIKINKITKRIVNEINDKITNDFENKIDSLNNASLLNVNKTISFDVEISKKIDLNFF